MFVFEHINVYVHFLLFFTNIMLILFVISVVRLVTKWILKSASHLKQLDTINIGVEIVRNGGPARFQVDTWPMTKAPSRACSVLTAAAWSPSNFPPAKAGSPRRRGAGKRSKTSTCRRRSGSITTKRPSSRSACTNSNRSLLKSNNKLLGVRNEAVFFS